MNTVKKDYRDLCASLKAISQKAVQYIHTQKFDSSWLETKSKNSFVSRVDKTSEGILVEALQKLLPEAGFLTEEETILKPNKDLRWIIDPLDGTTNYMHGIPCYCVSIALEVEGKIVIGLIHEVTKNECFYAWQGGGAYLGDHKIEVSRTKTLSDSLLATGFPYYDFAHQQAYMQLLSELMQQTRGLRRMGSACADLAYVACGRFDGFFEYSLHPWDVAAGSLIVHEAGGICSDFKGEGNYTYGKSILCGNANIHPQILQKVQSMFYDI